MTNNSGQRTADSGQLGRSFEITMGPGQAWTLHLLEDGAPAGGGQFPEDAYSDALEYGQSWCGDQVAAPNDSGQRTAASGGWMTCCVGVDVPGVGFMHASECKVKPGGVTPFGADTGRLPEPLHSFVSEPPCRSNPGEPGVMMRAVTAEFLARTERERRENLFGVLLFAARDLAERNIRSFDSPPRRYCLGCHAFEHKGKIKHGVDCFPARVLSIIDELLKCEPAAVRGLTDRVCLKCGQRGGEWLMEEVPEAGVDPSRLGLNQLIGGAEKPGRIALHTHVCEGGAR